MAVLCDHGGDIDASVALPGDFAGAIGSNGCGVVFRIAAADEDAFAIGDGGGDTFFGGTVQFPKFFAGERIETGDEVAAGQDHLGATASLDDGGCGVVRNFGTRLGPDDAAAFAIESSDEAAASMIGGNEDE